MQVTRVNVLEGDDSEKKIKQMKTFSGRDTVPQVGQPLKRCHGYRHRHRHDHCCCES